MIPVPGHTRGSVCFLWRDRFLFTGDHLAWSGRRGSLTAFRSACWYDWGEQTRSMERPRRRVLRVDPARPRAADAAGPRRTRVPDARARRLDALNPPSVERLCACGPCRTIRERLSQTPRPSGGVHIEVNRGDPLGAPRILDTRKTHESRPLENSQHASYQEVVWGGEP